MGGETVPRGGELPHQCSPDIETNLVDDQNFRVLWVILFFEFSAVSEFFFSQDSPSSQAFSFSRRSLGSRVLCILRILLFLGFSATCYPVLRALSYPCSCVRWVLLFSGFFAFSCSPRSPWLSAFPCSPCSHACSLVWMSLSLSPSPCRLLPLYV